MLSTSLPDINAYAGNRASLKENKVVLADTNEKYFYPEHRTPYLFISNFLNKGKYVLNKRHIEISDKHFYFLNSNDDLEINFPKGVRLQTLLILFEENFIENCFSSLQSPAEDLLDSPIHPSNSEFTIPNVPFNFTDSLRAKTEQVLQKSIHKEDLDSLLFELITEFYLVRKDTLKQVMKIDAVKKSTQQELYRRLFLAREFIHDNVGKNLNLDQIAKEACLNKFHLLSNFKTVFDITPHQYHTELKLQKAFQLLQSKKHSITEVSLLVGFESIGSFSNLFKRRFKISPSSLF
jgi:AraC family transcriptional regulator